MKILNEKIYILNLNSKIEKKLISNNIIYVKDLWILTRKDLRNLNFSGKEVRELVIKMELNGIGLSKKTYN